MSLNLVMRAELAKSRAPLHFKRAVPVPRPDHHSHLQVIEDRGWWYVRDNRTGARSRPEMWAGGAELVKWQLALRDLINE